MRGADEQTGALFSYLSPDELVPKDHPLRACDDHVLGPVAGEGAVAIHIT